MQTHPADDYERLVDELAERLAKPDPMASFRQIAREEADRGISGRLGCLGFIAVIVGAAVVAGWVGAVAVIGAGIAWLSFLSYLEGLLVGFDKSKERHRIMMDAEDIARLEIVTAEFLDGKMTWGLQRSRSGDEGLEIVAVQSPRWDRFWEITYQTALKMESESPRARRARKRRAARAAKPALKAAKKLSDQHKAKMIYWAQQALHESRR